MSVIANDGLCTCTVKSDLKYCLKLKNEYACKQNVQKLLVSYPITAENRALITRMWKLVINLTNPVYQLLLTLSLLLRKWERW